MFKLFRSEPEYDPLVPTSESFLTDILQKRASLVTLIATPQFAELSDNMKKDIITAAVRSDPVNIGDVPKELLTKELCMAAVTHPSLSSTSNNDDCEQNRKMKRVMRTYCFTKLGPEIYNAIYHAAIKNNPYAISKVLYQTPELCLAAVKRAAYALRFCEYRPYEVCLASAIGGNITYIPRITWEFITLSGHKKSI